MMYTTCDFDYTLPQELIAQYPLPERRASRMMHLLRDQQCYSHRMFAQFLEMLTADDLLVFNNTRVFPARLLGRKDSGGQLECMIERLLPHQQVIAQLRASKTPKPGAWLHFNGVRAKVLKREDDLFTLQFDLAMPMLDWLHQAGQIPLPPYVHRQVEKSDISRYQTVYASQVGAVAAPTAGLHFDDKMLADIAQQKIAMVELTLHVGAGTFAPVRVNDLSQHKMHSEYIEVSEKVCQAVANAKARGGRVIAIGTTVLRALESAASTGQLQPFSGDSHLFITPGYQFNCVDALLTNFHLPKSTLLMLICAFSGYELAMNCYQQAIAEKYRFFSYGDCMLIA